MSLSHVSEGSLQKMSLYQTLSWSMSLKNIENAQHIFPELKVTSSFCLCGPKPKDSSLTITHEEKQLIFIFKKLEAVWYHCLEMTKLLIDYQNSWQQLSFSDWWLQLYLLFLHLTHQSTFSHFRLCELTVTLFQFCCTKTIIVFIEAAFGPHDVWRSRKHFVWKLLWNFLHIFGSWNWFLKFSWSFFHFTAAGAVKKFRGFKLLF